MCNADRALTHGSDGAFDGSPHLVEAGRAEPRRRLHWPHTTSILVRIEDTKTDAGKRTIQLPRFAIAALVDRRKLPYLGEQAVIFPSTAGTLRDPNNFGKQWRTVREDLGVPEVTTHSFRKTVATLIDDEGLSARIGADQLGHAKVSMTQDRYMSRGWVHTEVAELLDRTIKDE